MSRKNPFTYPKLWRSFDSLRDAMEEASKRPAIGVTQGGSSRKYAGARPAATDGLAAAELQEPK